jgi:hypothetical protein
MIRNDMTADSATVAVLLNTQLTTLRRNAQGETPSLSTSGPATVLPCWLKLERRGANITSYSSADGNTWNKLATDHVQMNSHVFVGLVVAGHDATRKATSRFDSLTFTKK